MLDYWGQELPAGQEQEFKVVVINDLYQDCQGTVRLRLMPRDNKVVASQETPCTVAALGSETVSLKLPLPSVPGAYTLVAELRAEGQKPVRSFRDAEVAAK
jgi:hypothetical protein